MRLSFVKMEGVGNDYIYVDAISQEFAIERAPECARRWSDRHFGIGADGLILMLRGERAPVRMAMWNADGSRAEMCGNGLRCLAALAHGEGHVAERRFTIETDSGPRECELLTDGRVRASMGEVSCSAEAETEVLGRRILYHRGDAGNPHAVVFVDDVDRVEVAAIGRAMQTHRLFPDGVNVEFVAVTGPATLRQRTFERGSGETLACGTGAAVAAIAARESGRVAGDLVEVVLRGGTLTVVLDGTSLAIEGSARTVYWGEIERPE